MFKGTAKNFWDFNKDGSKKDKSAKINHFYEPVPEKSRTVSWSDEESDSEESRAMGTLEKVFGEAKTLSVEVLTSIPIKNGKIRHHHYAS